jgi:hypothetical protein
MIVKYIYKNVLQRAGWALPMSFLYIHEYFQNRKSLGSRRACACSEAGFSSQNGDRT